MNEEQTEGVSEGLGTASIPPLVGEHIPAAETEGIHPDAGGAPGQVPDTSTADLLSGLLMMVHGLAAARFGEHWRLTPEEAGELASAAGAVIDKYAPGISAGPEVRLIVTAGAVYGIRYMAHQAWRAEQEARKPKEPAGDVTA